MEAGRELDALVAEEVMGWGHLHEEERYFGSVGSGRYTVLVGNPPEGFQPSLHEDEVPAYSTDIAAAWEVVEKLTNGGMTVSVDYGETRKNWWCFFSWYNGLVREVYAEADTAPHAICLAALKAIGAEIDD